MAGRVLRWVGGGLLVGLLPLFVAYALGYYEAERPPGLASVLRSGQGLLLAVGWSATALREVRETPDSRANWRDVVIAGATAVLIIAAALYGALTSRLMAGRPQSAVQVDFVVWMSSILGCLAAGLSTFAAAVGTPEERGT